MRQVCTILLLVTIAVTIDAETATIGEKVRALASRYPASTTIAAHSVTYTVFAYEPVRGYENLISYREYEDGTNVLFLTIYEHDQQGDRLTVVVDLGADERPEYEYIVIGRTIDEAYRTLASDRMPAIPVTPADREWFTATLARLRLSR